jgi:hypothetical protein
MLNLDTVEERRKVVGSSTVEIEDKEISITLNGKPAVITGCRRDFAYVCQLRGTDASEWSWEAVRRILAREKDPGAFKF